MGRNDLSIIIVVSLTIAGLFGFINSSSIDVSAYTSHPPIFIDGNGDFRPVNGVTGGTGAQDNPFIIEGWEIDASTEDGIVIKNTDAYFVIRDCYIHSGSPANNGIYLDNVVNGQIMEVLSSDNGHGITVISSANNLISNNNISLNTQHGIFSMSCNEVNIVNNDFVSNRLCGIFLSQVDNSIIDSNNISDTEFDGIRLDAFNESEVSDNLVRNNGNIGLYLIQSSNVSITSNVVSSNTWDGIHILNSTYVAVESNDVASNEHVGIEGIELVECHIAGNTVSLSSMTGLSLQNSLYNDIIDNHISPGNNAGISLDNSKSNTILNNEAGSNGNDGISLSYSDENDIIGNDCPACESSGISLTHSDGNDIEDNILASNYFEGVILRNSNNNTIRDNIIHNNSYGIGSWASNDNEIRENSVYWNKNCGISMYGSFQNRIYHNDIIGNNNQSSDNGDDNYWDNGYPDGGNFWNDYTGTDQYRGVNQNSAGSDDIGDTPYEIDADSNDNYPLMESRKFSEPSAPENLKITSGDTLLNLSWGAPPTDGGFPITGYRVYRGNVPGERNLIEEAGTNQTYSDPKLINGETYYYTVTAVNAIGESMFSEEESAIPATYPSQPEDLDARAGDSYVSLSWHVPDWDGGSPVTVYRIYKGTVSGNVSYISDIGNVTSYNDTTVFNNIEYYYRVSAVNSAGEGPLSGEVGAFPTKPPNRHPSCSISFPSDLSIVSGIVEISGHASDQDGIIEVVQIRLDNGTWNDARGTTSWNYILYTTTLSEGQHTIYARSYDGQNFSSEDSITLNVDNTIEKEKEVGSLLDEHWFLVTIVIMIIAGLSFTIAFIFKKNP